MPLLCRNPYCSWASMFAFCVELLAVLATQYHPNALTNSNLDLATTIILPYQPGRNMNENSFHILKWGIHSAQERPGVEQQDAGKQGPRITQESSEEADAAPCYPENTMLSCMHHSCALQRWNEGQVFSTLLFHKTSGKDTESCSDQDMGTGNRFLVFPALPCCCRYWNFNPAVGYQESGSHRSVGLCAATPAVPPAALRKQLVVHPQSPGNTDMCTAEVKYYQFHRLFSYLFL